MPILFPNNSNKQDLLSIDALWIKHSQGKFGFSIQKYYWNFMNCKSSASGEETLGNIVGWRKSNRWIGEYDGFDYGSALPKGCLPRNYIFALSGWRSYCKGLTGYLRFGFDSVFCKL